MRPTPRAMSPRSRSLGVALSAGLVLVTTGGVRDVARAAIAEINVVTFQLPRPPDPYRHFEPSIAVDPDDADRVMLVSSRRRGDPFRNRDYAWFSGDGGATWSRPQFYFKHAYPTSEHGAGDPVVVAGRDGAFYATSMAYRVIERDAGTVRRDGLLLAKWAGRDAVLAQLSEVVAYEWPVSGGDAVDQSLPPEYQLEPIEPDFHQAALRPEQLGADKEWVAIDRSGGARDGWIYVVWDPTGGERGPAHMAVSRDDGKSFEVRALDIAPTQRGPRTQQVKIRSDGTVDLAWVDAHREAVVHSWSADGGSTWSDPMVVRRIRPFGSGPSYIDQISLTTLPSGGLVLCGIVFPDWRPDASFTPPRETAYCAASADGRIWQPATPLDPDVAAGTRVALPIVTAMEDAVWATAYRMTDATTQLVLYRSANGGADWEQATILAESATGSDSIRTVAGLAPVVVGDYMGLAAARGRLYAAYVLPSAAGPDAEPALYVSRIDLATQPSTPSVQRTYEAMTAAR